MAEAVSHSTQEKKVFEERSWLYPQIQRGAGTAAGEGALSIWTKDCSREVEMLGVWMWTE